MSKNQSAERRFAPGLLRWEPERTINTPLAIVACALIALLLGVVTAHSSPGMAFVHGLRIDGSTPTILYAATPQNGLFKTTDGGASWMPTGLTNTFVMTVAVDPSTPSTVYASPYYRGVWKSLDGGATWYATTLTNEYVSDLAIDPITGTIYGATPYASSPSIGAVQISTDGGTTWWREMMYQNSAVQAVTIDPTMPTTVYAGLAPNLVYDWTGEQVPVGGGLYIKSVGTGWRATGLDSGSVSTIVVDPQNPSIIYALVDGAVLKTVDGGETWAAITYGVVALALDPTTPSTVYAASYWASSGVLKSTDAGGTWRANAMPFPVQALVVDPVSPATLYAATSGGGVLKSMDAGATWNATGPIVADAQAPETQITRATDASGVAVPTGSTTLSTSLTITMSGTDNAAVAGFECRLDGGSFAACSSPVSYAALSLGAHTLEVRAVDTSDNVDATPARHTWTVDAAPETTISGAVDGRNKPLTEGGSTSSDKVTFRFTGTDNGTIARFECGLDAAAFASCTSPVTYAAVSRGTHKFRVRAVDNNGFADPSPAVFNWTR